MFRFIKTLAIAACVSVVVLPSQARADMTDLLISNSATNQINEYTSGGTFVRTFISAGEGLVSPGQMNFGPDGNLYVSTSNGTLEFNGTTGAFIRNTGLSGTVIFAPDGSTYQALHTQNRVERVNLSTAAVLQTYTSMIQHPSAIAFRPNGDLLVANAFGSPYGTTITEVNPTTGAASTFSPGGSGEPFGLVTGPDGRYYVANGSFGNGGALANTVSVVGASGGTPSLFTGLGTDGNGLAFDGNNLFVVSYYTGKLFEIDGSTGTIDNTFNIAPANQLESITVFPSVVPEPPSLILAGLGVAGLLAFARRKANREKK